jgi:excisionase family DNA binding protein
MVVVDGVEMVDVQEAAQLVRRSAETVRRWVWTGRVTHIKQGNRLLIPRAALTTSAPGSASAPSTLSAWLDRRAKTIGSARGGRSAADLVLEDRSDRSGQARAGR